MTDAELRALCEAATPGPWKTDGYQVDGPTHMIAALHWEGSEHDAALIVAARTELPRLLDRVRELEAGLRDAAATIQRGVTDLEKAYHERGVAVQRAEAAESERDGLREMAESRRASLDDALETIAKLRAQVDELASCAREQSEIAHEWQRRAEASESQMAKREDDETTRAVCCAENEDRANTAEAKLAKAVEALTRICQTSSSAALVARDALAAIKGTS